VKLNAFLYTLLSLLMIIDSGF